MPATNNPRGQGRTEYLNYTSAFRRTSENTNNPVWNTSCALGRPSMRSSDWDESREPELWVAVHQPCLSHSSTWSRPQGICFPAGKCSGSPRVTGLIAVMYSYSLGLNKGENQEGLAQCSTTIRQSSFCSLSYLPNPLRPCAHSQTISPFFSGVCSVAVSQTMLSVAHPCEAEWATLWIHRALPNCGKLRGDEKVGGAAGYLPSRSTLGFHF